MKKLFVTILVCITTYSLFAQHTNFGLKTGYNSSSVQISDGADYDSKSGLHIGGLAHIHISEHFAVQPELVFSCQGGERPNSKLKLNYINVPVLAQYMIGDGFRLQTGPQFGFLVSAEQKIGDIEVDIDDAFNSFDLSWAFGASYIFSSGIGIDARYNLGLNNISDDSDFEAKNRVFQVGLFYQFRNDANRKK
jgi:Outer membrane protein beta-barrel domain